MKVKADMDLVNSGQPKDAVYSAYKCAPLKFGRGKTSGKSWDNSVTVFDMEGNKIANGWIDSTWGHWVYFWLKDDNGSAIRKDGTRVQWYSFDVFEYKEVS